MQYSRRFILLFLLLLLLAGCGAQAPTEPSTVPTNPSTTPTGDPIAETQPPQPDTVLDVTEINLADFENSLLLFVFEADGCKIFRIYEDGDHFIELYEADVISDGAILDGPIPVRSAVRNTTHLYHYLVLDNLFDSLHNKEKKTVLAGSFSELWQSENHICFLRANDMYYVQDEEAQEIHELIQTYYDNRGTGIQIGGAIPS